MYFLDASEPLEPAALQSLGALLHDRMTESLWLDPDEPVVFSAHPPRQLRVVRLGGEGRAALARANAEWGLALSSDEIDYLVDYFGKLGPDPTDAELVIFARRLRAQDLHRRVHRRRPAHGIDAIRDDSRDFRGQFRRSAVRVS